MRILADVETEDLISGDIVVHSSDGFAYVFCWTETIPDSNYLTLRWREQMESGTFFSTTAQSWDIWPVVIRNS